MEEHSKVFVNIPLGIPPHYGFEYTIKLEVDAKPVITTTYRHPRKLKNEIEKTIQELLEKGWICPNSSSFASSVVLVKKKDGMLYMCRLLCVKQEDNKKYIPYF